MTAPEPFTAEQLDCLERFARSSPRVAIEGATLRHLIAQAREANRLRKMLDGQTFVLPGPPDDPAARAKRELGEWLAANSFPPEVVERAIEAGKRAFDDCIGDDEEAWHRARLEAHWSVIANYLRSEEARYRVETVLCNSWDANGSIGGQFDAVISALFGEKEQG